MIKYGLNEAIEVFGNRNATNPLQSFTSVRVIDIILDDKHPHFDKLGNWDSIGIIEFQPIYINSTLNIPFEEKLFAKPVNINIKQFPLKGEIVTILFLPDSQTQNTNVGSFYYLPPINIWNNTQHNALPDITKEQQTQFNEANQGIVTKEQNISANLGNTFKEKDKIHPLLPYEGDIIYEGRLGQSIRLGSTVKNSNIPNPWSSDGDNGDPCIIIRNSPKTDTPKESWIPIVEDINKDGSSIYIGSNQKFPILESSSNRISFNNKKYQPVSPNQYNKDQIILTSGRLLFNAKSDSLLISAAKSISLSSNGTTNIDSKNDVIINAPRIDLGNNASQPILLGDKTVLLLKQLIKQLSALCIPLQTLVGVPAGSPVIPVNLIAGKVQDSLELLLQDLDNIKSKNNFTI